MNEAERFLAEVGSHDDPVTLLGAELSGRGWTGNRPLTRCQGTDPEIL